MVQLKKIGGRRKYKSPQTPRDDDIAKHNNDEAKQNILHLP